MNLHYCFNSIGQTSNVGRKQVLEGQPVSVTRKMTGGGREPVGTFYNLYGVFQLQVTYNNLLISDTQHSD